MDLRHCLSSYPLDDAAAPLLVLIFELISIEEGMLIHGYMLKIGIGAYVEMGMMELASELFDEMEDTKVKPNNCTLVNILSACARIEALSQATTLVDMYSKCGNIEKATRVFRSTSRKDISIWNSIISGLSTRGFGE
ncbi:hypothetical protein JRO89_XS09G0131800 [Xanthoceras sorbifolium]|uniref:Pentatricopeptide repeat-containing protein n=1 Tax=Xanthoceras sorbifolium TaxID=99658 RepID=A0ABQ8HL48_9ROSI|nr:hypothetical protein JRO89_XS09G0131800 [Xanthoceras sorbifolium]